MTSFTSFSLAKRALISVPKFVRGYATPTSKIVKIPLTLYGIEGRYSTALFTAASKKNNLEHVETELKKVKSVIEKDPNIRSFLEDPSLSRQKKKDGVHQLLKDGNYCDTTKNFFTVLAENGRLTETIKIINAYQSLMTANRNEIPVTIISAKVGF
ncbi:4223_t:CDS:2 [Funneliformis caledonium]|uniref:ATP synthase subunit 5, mitochondrial n=1 Tax=Funneliformis caledonium TaxID=1117310 RepID=A0A9N9H1N5_9GLOM|nr:4223_t:CDS:2 [Funneliformis caledonium]